MNYFWLSQSTDFEKYEDYDKTTEYNIKQSEHSRYYDEINNDPSNDDVFINNDVSVGENYGQWVPNNLNN